MSEAKQSDSTAELGGVKSKEAIDHEPGTILGVKCECSQCGHHWKPRGVTQWIDALVD